MLKPTRKPIYDEEGEKTGYFLYMLSLPEAFPKILAKIGIEHGDRKYTFTAIPIIDKPQTYYIKPTKIANTLNLNLELSVLDEASHNTVDAITEFIFYNQEQNSPRATISLSKFDILSYLGYIQVDNKLILGSIVSESGITRIKPVFNDRKMIISPLFKRAVDKIMLSSWILSVFYNIYPGAVNEYNKNYLISHGIQPTFKESIDKLVELGYLFKNNGKIYDVYTLFNILDPSYREFAYSCFKLGNNITHEKMNELFEKYKIDINEKKEKFAKLYSNVISFYISKRFEELLDAPEENKAKILRILGLDYKGW